MAPWLLCSFSNRLSLSLVSRVMFPCPAAVTGLLVLDSPWMTCSSTLEASVCLPTVSLWPRTGSAPVWVRSTLFFWFAYGVGLVLGTSLGVRSLDSPVHRPVFQEPWTSFWWWPLTGLSWLPKHMLVTPTGFLAPFPNSFIGDEFKCG